MRPRRLLIGLSIVASSALAGAVPAAITLLTHHVELENEQVRVVRARYEPLATTGMHEDPDRVVIPLSDLDVVETAANGGTAEIQKTSNHPFWGAAARHSIESQSGQPIEAIEVELLGDEENYVQASAQNPSTGDAQHYRVLLEEHRVRVLDVHLGAHEKSIRLRHTDGVLVAMTEAHLSAVGSANETRTFDLLRGQSAWWPAATDIIENAGDSACELVWVELKHVKFPHTTSTELSTAHVETIPASASSSAVEVLTPTEGVDFAPYVDRVIVRMKRNWYALMPETARRGEKGRVVVEFNVLHDGKISEVKSTTHSASSVLESAALAAVHTSSPFDPLPKDFHGPLIRLKFTFLYNVPAEPPTRP